MNPRGKRQLIKSLTVALSLMFVSSCQPPNQKADRITLRLANWGGVPTNSEYERTIARLYAEFEKENPDIDLKIERIPGEYVPKMLLSFVADVAPDLMMLDASSAAVFINNGVLVDLKPLMDRDSTFKIEDYFSNAVDVGRRGESIYAIPQDFTPMVMYYNKRIFDDAKVSYPKPGWTWEDFKKTARELKKGLPNNVYPFVFKNWMPGWVMWLWNGGGEVFDSSTDRTVGTLDRQENVRTIEFLRDLINIDQIAPTLSHMQSLGVDLFATGQAAMDVSGHWSMVTYKNSDPKILDFRQLGVVELPRKNRSSESTTVFYESGYAITKNCKHQEAAWRLIKFMTGYRFQREYNSTGIGICGRKDVAFERQSEPLEADFLRIVQTARPPLGSSIEGYDNVEDLGRKMMDSVLKQNRDVEVALQQMAGLVDKDMARR